MYLGAKRRYINNLPFLFLYPFNSLFLSKPAPERQKRYSIFTDCMLFLTPCPNISVKALKTIINFTVSLQVIPTTISANENLTN